MADHTTLPHRFFLSISLLSILAVSQPDLTKELVSLRSSSESGVIRLTDDTVSKFITSVSTPRPYSLIIFFNSIDLNSNPLQEFRREFAFVSASFIANNNNRSDVANKVFFCEIDESSDSEAFGLFGIQFLPQICLVDPLMENLQDKTGRMEEEDVDGTAESVVEFIESRTNLTVGPLHRPPLLSKTQISVIVALIAISTPFLIKKVLKGETVLHNSRVWLFCTVLVYFFSVSGTMHNIIKGMPMFVRDHEDSNKLVFFYKGENFQLGAEGLSVGLLYNVVGLLLAYVTNALVRVRSVSGQRVFMMLAMVVSLLAVKKVVYLNSWKTGYEIQTYWPSSWH
ncbi:probable dolichyl-diphosphooligosaccharide--protein glycosyltransferase subunit 3B [Brassica rapa]|uniref:Dolichyl-diphosphooligosaccharide--protein glycosyltransferase subunit 3B n=2 Tax=Brassica TaxID=3705 RepID=A0ABQ8CIG0_BRANA|nr:probable dolichyl-diphosphooligosaccharide--protein glycosyltransferase subunit 3B [Brassica napus]XP_018509225.1 probable dolichyl-diphosphooligosaccharide--protein glycosyltransferase subunit 3B [Brassica rapa]KAH0916552.1 hypothetical protein HID58_030998 [Brassica napus]